MKTGLILKQDKEDHVAESKCITPTLSFENIGSTNKNVIMKQNSKCIRKSSLNDPVLIEKLFETSTSYQNENYKSRVAKSMTVLTHSAPINRGKQQHSSKINFKTTARLRKINLNTELKTLMKSDTNKKIKSGVTGIGGPNSDVKSKVSKSDILQDYAKEDTSPFLSNKTKGIRPFRAYPEDPLTVMIGVDTAKLNGIEAESYSEFRNRMLDEERSKLNAIYKNMGRPQIPKEMDYAYLEKRRKNNIAAKRSRDIRRAKEDELAIRCAYLEQENKYLKAKIAEVEAIIRNRF